MKHSLTPRDVVRRLAPGTPVSGEALAEELGVTRAAVWKQIAALRALGLPIEARTNVGYCLPWPVELLDAARIAQFSGEAGAPVQVHWALDSTQDELARALDALPDLAVVLAEQQSGGRGRRGHDWRSPPCMGVYLSCLKRFAGGPATLSGLSIAAGVCAVHALAELGVPDLRLKWPNDLLARGAKLAGILIEVQGEYDGPCTARVGVGVNLHLPGDLHEAVHQPVIDLATLCDGTPPGRNVIAAAVIRHLRAGLLGFERSGLAPFLAAFARLDALAGHPLRLDGAGVPSTGTGRGIDERGALRVEHAGAITLIESSQVSVRLATGD
ncbi:MAG: biotin--[acetyl-CoA-carboxylase] ligase [Burkholderiales bacterium]|nr:biotin--[acetyl-CoA-carboxylase] ligase [Burkholderiales bacterium]